MTRHEKLITFKYQVADIKDNVFNGNQLAIMLNGQLITLADYDEDMGIILKSVLKRFEHEIDEAIKGVDHE